MAIRSFIFLTITVAVVGDTDNAAARLLLESLACFGQRVTQRLPHVVVHADVPNLEFTRTASGREGEGVVRRPDGREHLPLCAARYVSITQLTESRRASHYSEIPAGHQGNPPLTISVFCDIPDFHDLVRSTCHDHSPHVGVDVQCRRSTVVG